MLYIISVSWGCVCGELPLVGFHVVDDETVSGTAKCPYYFEDVENLSDSSIWTTYAVLSEIFIRRGEFVFKVNLFG